ncbi:MAG: orotidine-5'-phosphate decarboxylase, partial [Chthoniobacterales bacterium]|nr:orotidine-5'-phosphate decarboxylase [Chthoniobacterales bacterium]
LYTAEGPDVVSAVAQTGAKIFLDLKLHDIPNTVGKAVASAARLGVNMLTIHLSGGRSMIEAALAAATNGLTLLGVTVLTSMDSATLASVGIDDAMEQHVLRLARLGHTAGIRGLVASPLELRPLRSALGADVIIVTPGVRPDWAEAGDQKRFMTPRNAIKSGADYLVIGRPITAHKNPKEAIERILDEIGAELPR